MKRETGPRYKIEVFASTGPEVHTATSEKEALKTAASWHSRGVRARVTDTRTGRVIYGD